MLRVGRLLLPATFPLHLYRRRLAQKHPHCHTSRHHPCLSVFRRHLHRHTSRHHPCLSVFHPHLRRHTSRRRLQIVIASRVEATAKRCMVRGAMNSYLACQAVAVPIIRATKETASTVSVTHLLLEAPNA